MKLKVYTECPGILLVLAFLIFLLIFFKKKVYIVDFIEIKKNALVLSGGTCISNQVMLEINFLSAMQVFARVHDFKTTTYV